MRDINDLFDFPEKRSELFLKNESYKDIFRSVDFNSEKKYIFGCENHEDDIEINSLLANLQFSTNNDTTQITESYDEILSIINNERANHSSLHINKNNSSANLRPRKISMLGRILKSENNIVSRLNSLPQLKLKNIPIRTNNPFYKNFNENSSD